MTPNLTDFDLIPIPFGLNFDVCFCSLLISICIVGNFFVLSAFCVEPRLHSLTNYWIISLSCTDIVLATLVMPIATFRLGLPADGYWPLGEIFCEIFITLDVLCCTASIYCTNFKIIIFYL
jgi:hypothetical protein